VGVASAAIDISDGLLADLRHLCDVSDVAAVIDASRVPLSATARAVLAMAPERIVDVLCGGDDYEILFTAPDAAASELAELARTLDVPITAIGRVEPGRARERDRITVLDDRGQPVTFERSGWTHF
jgi:thiamine-monophosphate kinase